jgi:hypothetical protein
MDQRFSLLTCSCTAGVFRCGWVSITATDSGEFHLGDTARSAVALHCRQFHLQHGARWALCFRWTRDDRWSAYYRLIVLPHENPPVGADSDGQPPAFDHPLNSKPWIWRVWFSVTRLIYLGVLSFLWLRSGCLQVTDGEWRLRWRCALSRTLEAAGCTFRVWAVVACVPGIQARCHQRYPRLRDRVIRPRLRARGVVQRESFGREIEDIFDFFDQYRFGHGCAGSARHPKAEFAENPNNVGCS